MSDLKTIAALRISLASPEHIRAWSHGEVTKAETINYRTHKPERHGLFCERIFGPAKDWTCACGNYVRERTHRGFCEKCGVELARSIVRRERLGHIELAVPVAHSWFAHGMSNVMATLLNLSVRQLESILNYHGFLLLEINETVRQTVLTSSSQSEMVDEDLHRVLERMEKGQYLSKDEKQRLIALPCGLFRAETGAQALREVLAQLNLEQLACEVRSQCHQGNIPTQKKAAKRLRIVEAFRQSGVRPEWMILTALPVFPPDLRPLIPLDGGRVATSDLNVLYERILHRNARIRHFEKHGAPDIILHQEMRLLQKAVDALIDNNHQSHPVINSRRQPLKSLTDILSGKTGRLRKNLLGKRVDYSGRSVIVGNPRLQLHQCGLPKKMACELFKPFLICKLLDRHIAYNARAAKRMIERRHPDIWDQLAECLFERVILLNRAPTLHRLSIQAFEPVLIEGSAIQLHPQVCSAFNADFDGDQMAVHVPLSDAAQKEARELLLSTKNLRSPASGEPSLAISQEQVLGLFYLTQDRPNNGAVGKCFSCPDEALLAYDHGVIALHTRISVRLDASTIYHAPDQAVPLTKKIETTVGRLLFNEALPQALQFKEYAMTKERLKQLVGESLTKLGNDETARMADRLKTLGFAHATRAGISFSLSDIKLPDPAQQEITALIETTKLQVAEFVEQANAGMLSDIELEQQSIALWTEKTEQISKICQASIDPYGTLATIMQSGATKAKPQQIRQLNGIRGLMANPSGKIIPLPVLGNYYVGLLLWEVFIAASGARKGFMDRSLNTAMSGYLTRKLVEVGMGVWISQEDCGTCDGIWISQKQSQQRGFTDMRPLITGRVLAEDRGPWQRNSLLDEATVEQLLETNPDGVWVRSPLTCQAPVGLCRYCYGRDLATGQLVKKGAAVGVIAGQSIGEPGTQLTMRTFHSGGIANAQGDITQGLPRVSELFEARPPKQKALLSSYAGIVEIDQENSIGKRCIRIKDSTVFCEEKMLPANAHLLVVDQEQVHADQVLAWWLDPGAGHQEICASSTGQIRLEARNRCLQLWVEETHGYSQDIPAGAHICVTSGQRVEVGMPLTTGAPDPKELLALCGREVTARYLIEEVQRVYRTTGVYISDQHPELIVRQMLRYVQVMDEADTSLVPGEILDRFAFEQINAHILAQGGTPALAQPVLLGLVRAALQTSSWIAGASFQETARVLTQASIRRQVDNLLGLKEHVILGLLIPSQPL